MSLVIEQLGLGYRRQQVFESLSLSAIAKGQLVAVVGGNGVGKSTFLRALAGLGNYSGSVTWQQDEIGTLSASQRMRRIGYLPQTPPQASSLLAYELVLSACRAACVEVERVEQAFNELGIQSLATRELRELSGGQRQLLGLAQLLVREPQLLLLDEPTSALDLHWQLRVLEKVEALCAQGATALVVSHDLNLALRYCDQLVVLGGGGLLAQGAPSEVLDAGLLARAYQIRGRLEYCSQGLPLVLADRAI